MASLNPAYQCSAEWCWPKTEIVVVQSPARDSTAARLPWARGDRKPRRRPSENGSAAVPPCPTAPLWMPNSPVWIAERDGRHGESEV